MYSTMMNPLTTTETRSRVYVFASKEIQNKVYKVLEYNSKTELIRFITAAKENPLLSVIRGRLFEPMVHKILSRGGSFPTRRLVGVHEARADEATVTFPAREMKVFSKLNDIPLGSDYYWTPKSKTFESADSIILPNVAFQMTVGKSHDIQASGLAKILQTNSQFNFYFVVPRDVFDESYVYHQIYTITDGSQETTTLI